MTDFISGRVMRIVFNNDDFYILNLDVVDSDPPVDRVASARGHLNGLTGIEMGTPVKLLGKWTTHAKFGKQFTITSWEPWAQTCQDVASFLRSCVQGFGPIIEPLANLGPAIFKVLTHHPKALQDKPPAGVTPGDLETALLGWAQMLAVRDLAELLKAGGLGGRDIQRAITEFGMEAPAIIRANPYRLMAIQGFAFPKVDELAGYLGVSSTDPRRVEGLMLWALQQSALNGHLFLTRGEAIASCAELVDSHKLKSITPSMYTGAADALTATKIVIEQGGLYLPPNFKFERLAAKLLADMLKPKPLSVDPRPFIENYEKGNRITLSEHQRGAVMKLVDHSVLVLTGLPGSGKTTAVRALVRVFEEARIRFVQMAPTGIAAKRLSAVTGHPASTVHRALKYDGNRWGHDASNRFVVDAVVVDEMSMVDQELMYRLLSALQPGTRLVLVGDDAQLPSVGPGNVLKELIACPHVEHVRLTHIFRQSVQGEIVTNSHRIHRGEMPELVDPKLDTEFKFVRLNDEVRIVSMIVDMASKLKERNANFQVISPKYAGTVGVDNLNEQLRDRLNPEGPREWKRGLQRFRVGDRLMVVRNDYKKSVYNGDVGKLVEIDPQGLLVKIHGAGEGGVDMEVHFPHDDAEEKLRLAYAITVHRSQGSEFDTIIMPIVTQQGRMLQRNLFYTAVTRAKKKVWLLGDEMAVARAVANNQVMRRNTLFAKAISMAADALNEPVPPVEPAAPTTEVPSSASTPEAGAPAC